MDNLAVAGVGVTVRKVLLAGVAALSVLGASAAHAMNSKSYKCGDVDVRLAIVKDNGRPVGRNVYFRIKLRGDYPGADKGITRVRPEIKFAEIDDIREFSIAGKKYECTLVGEGFSDVED